MGGWRGGQAGDGDTLLPLLQGFFCHLCLASTIQPGVRWEGEIGRGMRMLLPLGGRLG